MTRLAHPVDEAAELLGCKPSWLREKARLREVPFSMVGGSYHFTDAHLEWILARFEVAPRPAVAAGPSPRPRKKPAPEPAAPSKRLRVRPSPRLRAVS